MAIGISTVLMLLSFSALLAGLADDTADSSQRIGAFGFGLAAVPFVFIALALLSRHRRAPSAILKSLGMFLVVAVPIALLSVVLGLYLGFGIGGIFSLRADEPHSYRTRVSALSIGLLYTVVLVLVAPGLGLFTAASIPLIAIGFGDEFAERRAAAAEDSGEGSG